MNDTGPLIDLSIGVQDLGNPWKDKIVLVTGAAGTVGRELLCQLLQRQTKAIIVIDNNETELFFAEQDFSAYDNISFLLTSILDPQIGRASCRERV